MNLIVSLQSIDDVKSKSVMVDEEKNCTSAIKRFQRFLINAKSKREKAQETSEKIHKYEAQIRDFSIQIEKRNAFHKYADVCAIKIQKYFRGYLIRSLYNEVILI